eukprot:scaffold42928_cov34-Prasinocladus_malaysianus.AAC.1
MMTGDGISPGAAGPCKAGNDVRKPANLCKWRQLSSHVNNVEPSGIAVLRLQGCTGATDESLVRPNLLHMCKSSRSANMDVAICKRCLRASYH